LPPYREVVVIDFCRDRENDMATDRAIAIHEIVEVLWLSVSLSVSVFQLIDKPLRQSDRSTTTVQSIPAWQLEQCS
jgi:hypothetical protein